MEANGVTVETVRAVDMIPICAMNVLYSLQHLGFSIPPQADAAWLGEARSLLPRSRLRWTRKRLNQPQHHLFMAWNLMHLARLLRDAGGFPAHGNQRAGWDAGCQFDFPNPSTADANPVEPWHLLGSRSIVVTSENRRPARGRWLPDMSGRALADAAKRPLTLSLRRRRAAPGPTGRDRRRARSDRRRRSGYPEA